MMNKIKRKRETLEKKINLHRNELLNLQEICEHPLEHRTHKNDGWSNDWDRTSEYWTSHTCLLCNKRWNTNQRWKWEGSGLGLPEKKDI